jgi:AcrR family transcriptional regulator
LREGALKATQYYKSPKKRLRFTKSMKLRANGIPHLGEALAAKARYALLTFGDCGVMKNSSESKENDTHFNIIEVAERLFRQIGFQKTTVADIARELQMSPANVYRFFAAKAEINEAVARRIFGEIEATIEEIARSLGPSKKKLRNVIASIETLNSRRFMSDRKLHELLETAYNENWVSVREHSEKIDGVLTQIISQGMAAGEFKTDDAELSAILLRSACIRYIHPRLMVECAQDPEPTLDQMMDFCLAALT